MRKTITLVKRNGTPAAAETIGLDLSDRTVQFHHLGSDLQVVERGSVPLTRGALTRKFGSLKPVRMVLETGGQSAWVKALLEEFGHEVIVANARELRSITGAPRKSDPRDAEQMARLGRVDPQLLKPVKLRSLDQQRDLMRIRVRATLVETRTKLVNALRGLAKLEGVHLPKVTSDRLAGRAYEALPDVLRSVLAPLIEEIGRLSALIEGSEESIQQIANEKYPETRWLTQVPGVGTLTALTFRLTLSDPERFRRSRDVGVFLGLTPKRRQSGELDPHQPISKCGDRYLRRLLVQCAHVAINRHAPDSALKRWALSRAGSSRSAKKRIVVAVARKLAVLLHRLCITQEIYRPFPSAAAA